VLDEPYAERRRRLEALPWPGPAAVGGAGAWAAPARLASDADALERAFDAARAAGNEGIIVKDPASAYMPGRRGKAWVKLKKASDTLDVVVTGVERGHGRRRHVLSDYTFAVRAAEDDPTLLNVGKAFTGLTDAEIAALTARFEALTVARHGRFQEVRPEVVLEVTFDYVQPSARHKAGYALRFPRIVRVRDDKPPTDVDTLARVAALAATRAGAEAPADPGGGDGDARDG
jgi:DNA ligase-1